MKDLIDIFLQPSGVLGRLKDQPNYWLPLGLLVGLTAVSSYLYFDRVDAALSAWEKAGSAERRRWFGQFITRYRSAGDIQAAPDQPDWQQALTALSTGQCLQRHPFARFAWAIEAEQALLHVSGESFHMPAPCAQKLCVHAQIDADTLSQLSTSAQSALQHLLLCGVYQLAEAE